MTMLEVSDLRKRFVLEGPTNWWGKRSAPLAVHAVEGVSFSVGAGEVLTIVGESGCGKTTVAKMLVGLVPPSGGAIRVDGQELSGERTPGDRRLIQLVSQNPWSALNRRRSIRHALEQPLTVHEPGASKAERTRRVEEMVERVGLATAHLDKRPGDVSGGELARAVLARALVAGPKVIVLDEPTASLDASVKATVINLLLDLRAELGLCMVLITHELPVARRLADQAAVMYLGRFVETGPAAHVLHAPTHPYARMLLASVPQAEPGAILPAPGRDEVPSAVALPAGCSYHPRCAYRGDECTASVPELTTRGAGAIACHRTVALGMPAVGSGKHAAAEHCPTDSATEPAQGTAPTPHLLKH
ncbi:MAG: ABC transporter ATP-binding protein [Jatrophihabitantaceae bacterium]